VSANYKWCVACMQLTCRGLQSNTPYFSVCTVTMAYAQTAANISRQQHTAAGQARCQYTRLQLRVWHATSTSLFTSAQCCVQLGHTRKQSVPLKLLQRLHSQADVLLLWRQSPCGPACTQTCTVGGSGIPAHAS
jgi:hypothetical protein